MQDDIGFDIRRTFSIAMDETEGRMVYQVLDVGTVPRELIIETGNAVTAFDEALTDVAANETSTAGD